ncbi:hypothetical protein [Methylobacterium sp. SyP6R]|uniref:hypothetical protein n=1 Tax=Methylobacterium sp. SyP6R TaxID=2718876 RepID=UPI003FA526E7
MFDVETVLGPGKILRRVASNARGAPFEGYEIHMGETWGSTPGARSTRRGDECRRPHRWHLRPWSFRPRRTTRGLACAVRSGGRRHRSWRFGRGGPRRDRHRA